MTNKDIVLFDDYIVRHLDRTSFSKLFKRYQPVVFEKALIFHPDEVYTGEEKQALRNIQRPMADIFRLRLGIFHQDDTFAGWHVGWQRDSDRYYMASSGILPQFQNKGIYTHLLPIILDLAQEKGFQIVESRHTAANNRVIIPKLKAGFIISGMEISDQFGTLVWLRYFFNPIRRRVVEFRTGELVPDAELRQLLKLDKTS